MGTLHEDWYWNFIKICQLQRVLYMKTDIEISLKSENNNG
jgi:hypothetical protein